MKITVIPNGPILMDAKGEWRSDGGGSPHKQDDRVALCRCGHSAKKPFCDGAHKRMGFVGPGGELHITPK